jgi:hypothetical protein
VLSGLQSVSCNVYIADFLAPPCTLHALREQHNPSGPKGPPAKIDPAGPAGTKARIGVQWGEKDRLRIGPDFFGKARATQTSLRCARGARVFRSLLRIRSIEKWINRSRIGRWTDASQRERCPSGKMKCARIAVMRSNPAPSWFRDDAHEPLGWLHYRRGRNSLPYSGPLYLYLDRFSHVIGCDFKCETIVSMLHKCIG